MKWTDNDDNDDKYNNNRHTSIEIINSEKLKLLKINIDFKVKFAYEL